MTETDALKSSPTPPGSGAAVQNAAFRPLYKQIKQLLLQKLQAGEWKPGTPIPSELDLVGLFGVSHGTIRKAIDELAAENVLIRRQGKGTFVATHLEASIRHRFLRFRKRSELPGNGSLGTGSRIKTKSHFLSLEIQNAPSGASDLLNLLGEGAILNICRVIEFNDVPTVLERIMLPADIFRGLTLDALRENDGPLYGFFESRYDISMIRAHEELSAVQADEDTASALKIKVGEPLLQVDRVAFTYGDRPIEVRQGRYLTQDYIYQNTLN